MSCTERIKQISHNIATMEALTEDFSRPEEMTVLAPEDFSEQNIDTSDEVENLRKRGGQRHRVGDNSKSLHYTVGI